MRAAPVTHGEVRIDLHCHSLASNRAAESALRAIQCPECYSPPLEVYDQARRRGMDFVTITDHDSLAGVLTIADRADVLTGVELTCWFPEDSCKMHVLLYGLCEAQHVHLQSIARDIYKVADYVETNRIAHAVAHPIYRQNDRLEKWHVERLLLIFKGFECLNGAHSSLHRDAFEPLLDGLTLTEIERLSRRHDLKPLWPEPWHKARIGGSDDHGLLNIGRTYTVFPADVTTTADVLEALRVGRCRPGGEAGSSAKLAHTFYAVGVRYYVQQLLTENLSANWVTTVLQILVGKRKQPTKWEVAKLVAWQKARRLSKRLTAPFRKPKAPLFRSLFIKSLRKHHKDHPSLLDALAAGLPPLGEHDEMFSLVSKVNRDVTRGIADEVQRAIDQASYNGFFDSMSAIMAHQFTLAPYYFALFHQNKERHLLRQLTGQRQGKTNQPLKVALFTDTLDEMNGVARFIKDMATQASARGRSLSVYTSAAKPAFAAPWRVNTQPLLHMPFPRYPQLTLSLPSLLEILESADREQFDAVHVSTPGPMGLCGWMAARMLRVPLIGTYHTDFPAYAMALTRDHRIGNAAADYMKWFYTQTAVSLTRSARYRSDLTGMGIPDKNVLQISAGVDTATFSPAHHDAALWARLGVTQPRRLLYVGRLSEEKNLALLADVFVELSTRRSDTALVLAGEGPFAEEFLKRTQGLPVYMLGRKSDKELGPLYASADLLLFPSRTDTLGQVVMESLCSGTPVVVSNEGGPRELVDDGETGFVLPATNVTRWVEAVQTLLTDETRRQWMTGNALRTRERFSITRSFEGFWDVHAMAAQGPVSEGELAERYPRFFARM